MENKFRAYDKWNKRFVPSCQVAVNSEGEVYMHESSEGYTRKVDSIEILEYSGKKDRHGISLYRGDIVNAALDVIEEDASRTFKYLSAKPIIGVVVIRPSEGARLLVKKTIPKDAQGIAIGRTLRIDQSQALRIGNIYINPELLEDEVPKKGDTMKCQKCGAICAVGLINPKTQLCTACDKEYAPGEWWHMDWKLKDKEEKQK